MTKSEFLKHLQENPKWAPGWDAIEEAFGKVYPGVTPEHFGTVVAARAAFGGDQYIDGYSFYPSPKGYLHIVTFGLSELYGNKNAFGKAYSGKGCELTMKVDEKKASDARWALDILSAVAKFAFTKKQHLVPYQIILGDDIGISSYTESQVRALFLIPDTEVKSIETVYGRVQFLQVLGLTTPQLNVLMSGASVEEVYKKEVESFIGDGVW